MNTIIWLLVAATSGGGSATTLATLNDKAACVKAANDIRKLTHTSNSPHVYTFCIPILQKAIVR